MYYKQYKIISCSTIYLFKSNAHVNAIVSVCIALAGPRDLKKLDLVTTPHSFPSLPTHTLSCLLPHLLKNDVPC